MRKLAASAVLIILITYSIFAIYGRYENHSFGLEVEIAKLYEQSSDHPQDEFPTRGLEAYKAIGIIYYRSDNVRYRIAEIYLEQIRYGNKTIDTNKRTGSLEGLYRSINVSKIGNNYVWLEFYANSSDVERVWRVDTRFAISRIHIVEYYENVYGTVLFTNAYTLYLRAYKIPVYANYTHFRFTGSKVPYLIISVDRHFEKYTSAVYVIEAVLIYYEAYLIYGLLRGVKKYRKRVTMLKKRIVNKIKRFLKKE